MGCSVLWMGGKPRGVRGKLEPKCLLGNREGEELVWEGVCGDRAAPAPPPCHGLVSVQGLLISGAELGWPTMGLRVWVRMGEDTGSQHRSVPANCSVDLFPPAPHGPPRAAPSRAGLCYPLVLQGIWKVKVWPLSSFWDQKGQIPLRKGNLLSAMGLSLHMEGVRGSYCP